ncbi:hypothetical protein ACFDR9_000383 [Janthinobacterium sp. CG_23.3]
MISVKKAVFVFFVSVGFAAAFSGSATARPSDTYCGDLLSECADGVPGACDRWERICALWG